MNLKIEMHYDYAASQRLQQTAWSTMILLLCISSSSLAEEKDNERSNNNNNLRRTATTASSGMAKCSRPYEPSPRIYQAGEIVSVHGNNYSCKKFPYTSWCSNEFYAPGTTQYWDLAWGLIEECEYATVSKEEVVNNYMGYTENPMNAALAKQATLDPCAMPYEQQHTYAAGEMVSSRGNNYKCRNYPATSWCSVDAYAPGVTNVWEMAWTLIDECQEDSRVTISEANAVQPYRPVASSESIRSCPPSWQLGRQYKEGERVTQIQELTIFECKEYPFTDSCGDPASQVGIGPIYEDVWRAVGKCVNGVVVDDITIANAATQLEKQRPTKKPTRGPRPNTRPIQSTAMLEKSDGSSSCGPRFKRNSSYSHNDIASVGGINYQCNLSQFCGKPKYHPGRSKRWDWVWDKLGACDGLHGSNREPAKSVNVSNTEQKPGPRPTNAKRPQKNKKPNKKPSKPQTRPQNIRPLTPANAYKQDSSPSGSKSGRCPQMWNLDQEYSAGDSVGAEGRVYTCKGHPASGWCGASTLYEPAIGAHWDMAWDVGANCEGAGTRRPTARPTTPNPTPKPTRKKDAGSSDSSEARPSNNNKPQELKPPGSHSTDPYTGKDDTAKKVFDLLDSVSHLIDDNLFLYQGTEPSSVYRYEGFIAGLRIMFEDGVAGKNYYLGRDTENGYLDGLVNIAAFIGQSMKETIQYDACDENSWDYIDMVYPLSNACGQLGQSYQDYQCPEHERHMECKVDKKMSIKATTHAKWYGAPGPLFCGPKKEYPQTGIWDYTYTCNNPWNDPPEYCTEYEGQKAGRYDNSEAIPNRAGRTDVEGCCWWGRGVIQTTGICNFGKLNYFLGKRAKDEGRDSRYPKIDFCEDPGIICSSEEHQELKWIAGMFYWIESLQSYDERGWNYMEGLHAFVDGGMADNSFIDKVSGIVNRGCHDPPCGTGPVDGKNERSGNFQKVMSVFSV